MERTDASVKETTLSDSCITRMMLLHSKYTFINNRIKMPVTFAIDRSSNNGDHSKVAKRLHQQNSKWAVIYFDDWGKRIEIYMQATQSLEENSWLGFHSIYCFDRSPSTCTWIYMHFKSI